MKSLKEVLTEQAPELLARTKLARTDPEYRTQRQAFDLHGRRRFEELAAEAPVLCERIGLPPSHPDHINTSHAFAIFRGRRAET